MKTIVSVICDICMCLYDVVFHQKSKKTKNKQTRSESTKRQPSGRATVAGREAELYVFYTSSILCSLDFFRSFNGKNSFLFFLVAITCLGNTSFDSPFLLVGLFLSCLPLGINIAYGLEVCRRSHPQFFNLVCSSHV